MKDKLELLAPAGSFPSIIAAVNAGADAVFFGLKEFSMRSNAKNFTLKDLERIKEICKPKKVKRYLTMNIIVYDNELKKIEETIKTLSKKKLVDAIICWDLAVIQLCKKYKIPFHISTQASISNTESAKFYEKLGAKKIVLARELSLKQVNEISKNLKCEIECFIHGAMCLSISGRCLMSHFLFNKSANRGECIHPCRRSYIIKDKQQGYELEVENHHVLSAKDLCALPFIEELKKAGITTFKIEGRNRDPRYVDKVVRVYRKALDKKLTEKENKELLEELKEVYNKELSSGFYIRPPTSEDFSSAEHSKATKKKHFIGKITKYYPKINVATIKLVSDVKLRQEIVIIGNTTGLINSRIDSMEIKNKKVKSATKGQEIGIKIQSKVRKNDEVYVVLKNKI